MDGQFIDTNTALKICEALIQPHFDYCSIVWDGLTPSYLHELFDLRSTGYNLRNLENTLYQNREQILEKEL